MPSTKGSFLARRVLKKTAKNPTAMTIKVPCQACGSYEETFSAIKPWDMVPTRKAAATRPACQPRKQTQPENKHQHWLESDRGEISPAR